MVAKLLPLVPYGEGVRVYVEPYCGGGGGACGSCN